MADRTINGIRYEDYPSTKQEALEGGFKWFYTGIPCKYNHIAPRNVSKHMCFVCKSLSNQAFIKTDKGKAISKKVRKKARALGKYDTPEYKKKKAERDKKYREENKEELDAKAKIWREKNPEKVIAKRRKNYEKNKEAILERSKIYHSTPRGKLAAKKAVDNYRKTEAYALVQRRARAKARKIPEKRLIMDTRRRINQLVRSVKGTEKQASTEVLIGCDKETFKKHIEKQFVNGMSWDNRSEWHIDHVIPLNFFIKHFDVNDINIQKIAFHYSNTQPLFAKDNTGKKDKIYIQHPESTFKKIVVDMEDDDYEIFVSLLKEEVQKKIQILDDNNTVKGIGKITDSVIKKYYEIVDEPT